MIKISGLKEIEKTEWPAEKNNVVKAYKNSEIVVLEYHRKIWWGFRRIKIKHLAIRTAKNVPVYKFYDLMDIKQQICGDNCEAVQFYPRYRETVDGANMTHLFVFPENIRVSINLYKWKNWHQG